MLGSVNLGVGSVPTAGDNPGGGTGSGDVDSVTATVPAVVNNTDPANPVINVFAGTSSPVGASSAGTSNDLSRGNHSHPVLEAATAAALAALAAASMNSGTKVYVLTYRDTFTLRAAGSSVAATDVRIAASGKAGFLWFRDGFSPSWWNQIAWFVTASAGANNENDGATALTPISPQEYRRRHFLRWLPGTETGSVSMTVVASLGANDVIQAEWGVGLRAGVQNLNVTGTVTGSGAGIVAGAIPVNRVTGQRNTITVAGIGAAGNVGKLIRLVATPTTTATIMRSLGANTVELSEQSVNGALGAGFVNGDNVEVVTATSAPGIDLFGGLSGTFTDIDFTGSGAHRARDFQAFVSYTRCRFITATSSMLIPSCTFTACSFSGALVNLNGRLNLMALCAQVNQPTAGFTLQSPPNVENTLNSHMSEASTFTLSERCYLHLSGGGSANMGFHNLAAAQVGISLGIGAHLDAGAMWGAGNNATSIYVLRPQGATLSGMLAAAWTVAGGVGIAVQTGNATFVNVPTTELPFVIGPGQQPGANAKFSGSLETDAVVPTVSYLADGGTQIAAAFGNLGPQRYASSERLVLGLRATHLTGPLPVGYTATLYINGVATLMQVTIPAATANGTKFSDFTHPRLLAAGDDFDVRLDGAGATGVAVTIEASACLEFAT